VEASLWATPQAPAWSCTHLHKGPRRTSGGSRRCWEQEGFARGRDGAEGVLGRATARTKAWMQGMKQGVRRRKKKRAVKQLAETFDSKPRICP